MRLALPWWLNPWRERKRLLEAVDYHAQDAHRMDLSITRLAAELREAQIVIGRLETDRIRAERAAEQAGRMVTQLQGGTGMSARSTQSPDWVMTGIPRPGIGVRVIASQQLGQLRFDMTAMDDPPPRHLLSAVLEQALFVDRPTYSEAIAEVGRIWANWRKDQPAGQLDPPLRGAIEP